MAKAPTIANNLPKRALLLGAAGAGMRGLAWLLAARGVHIIASDQVLLTARGESDLASYEWVTETETTTIAPTVDVVIRSDAVPITHPAIQVALTANVTCQIYSEALGVLMRGYTSVAVAGTHGKTSTTALLAHILIAAGYDPTVVIGARMPAWVSRNARVGTGNIFITEADEYQNHFLHLHPTHAIITNIDFDHPDFFSSLEQVEQSFQSLLATLPEAGVAVTTLTTREYHQIAWPKNTIAVPATAAVPLFGEHMRSNAALAIAMAGVLGVAEEEARAAITTFPGVGRRLEHIGSLESAVVLSDYGHHPAEIAATLEAVIEQYPKQKIGVMLEVHTAERAAAFGPEFVDALRAASEVVLVPVFLPPGRSAADKAAAALKLSAIDSGLKLHHINSVVLADYLTLESAVKKLAEKVPIIVGFSAGLLDSYLRQLTKTSF